jgi:predicted acetyltransferase
MIRMIDASEVDQVLDLTQVAFAVRFPESELEERRAQILAEPGWGYFIGNQLASRLVVLPLHAYLYGKPFRTGGIAHVASYPEHRRQGMVGKLLAHSLQAMKEDGQTFSMLNPFSYAFYRKYGWETFSEVKMYTLPVSQLPKPGHASGRIERLKPADGWEIAHRIYETYAVRFNGMLVRDESRWRGSVLRRKPGNLAVYYNADDVPRGYMLYAIHDRFMKIHEFVHLDEDSRRGLWQFIGNHDSMIKELSFSAPSSDRFAFTLSEPTVRQELHPNFMARIVDVGGLLRQLPFRSDEGLERFVLHVKDEHAPWNEGTFEAMINEDGIQAVSYSERPDADAGGVSCDIRTLTAMLTGFQRPTFLHELGRLDGDPEAISRWERLIPQSTTYLADFF